MAKRKPKAKTKRKPRTKKVKKVKPEDSIKLLEQAVESLRAPSEPEPTPKKVRGTQAEYNALSRAKKNTIPRGKCKNLAQRKRLENDSAKWLKFFMPSVFHGEFSEIHKEIIQNIDYSIENGECCAFAAPRGYGKTAICRGITLKLMFTKKVRMPVVVPWKASDAKANLRFWTKHLTSNKTLREYYPEYCNPFHFGDGNSAKIKPLRWEDTGEFTGAKIQNEDKIIVFPDSLGVIASCSLNGSPRGINFTLDNGDLLRPDFLLLDDPSDRQTAMSLEQTQKNIDMIQADVLGTGGWFNKIAVCMPCTIINEGDTASHYLNNPEWIGTIRAAVKSWPKDWDDEKSLSRDLWEEWHRIKVNGLEKKDKGVSAKKYYKENKKAMIDGFIVNWNDGYDKRNQPDAIYKVMENYYLFGHRAFFSEFQNSPISANISLYDLAPSIIKSRANKRPKCSLEDDYNLVIASTDINHYGLHWAVIGFRQDLTAQIIAYGNDTGAGGLIVPKNSNDIEIDKAVYKHLGRVVETIQNLHIMREGNRVKVDAFVIDGGYRMETVNRFINSYPSTIPMACAWGTDSRSYKVNKTSLIGKPKEDCHSMKAKNKYISFNSDKWKEVAQRAWLSTIGAPGSLSVFGKSDQHDNLANHVCAEKLLDKILSIKLGKYIYTWTKRPGKHDLGDAIYLCYVGAASKGDLTTGGVRRQTKRKPSNNKKRRRGGTCTVK